MVSLSRRSLLKSFRQLNHFKSISNEHMQINFNKFYLKLQILTICIEIAYARAAITDRGEGSEMNHMRQRVAGRCVSTPGSVLLLKITTALNRSDTRAWLLERPAEYDVLCARKIRKIVGTINPSFVWGQCNCDCIDCHYTKCRHTLHSLLHFLSPILLRTPNKIKTRKLTSLGPNSQSSPNHGLLVQLIIFSLALNILTSLDRSRDPGLHVQF